MTANAEPPYSGRTQRTSVTQKRWRMPISVALERPPVSPFVAGPSVAADGELG